ncbi:DnaA/Hda family protein [Escherichia coli]|nr:DnaA/Hda family protein [Escherichia coli]
MVFPGGAYNLPLFLAGGAWVTVKLHLLHAVRVTAIMARKPDASSGLYASGARFVQDMVKAHAETTRSKSLNATARSVDALLIDDIPVLRRADKGTISGRVFHAASAALLEGNPADHSHLRIAIRRDQRR